MAKNAFKHLNLLEEFKNIIIPLIEKSVKILAEIYSTLRNSGNTVDEIYLLIDGIATENEMTLVANNDSHFS